MCRRLAQGRTLLRARSAAATTGETLNPKSHRVAVIRCDVWLDRQGLTLVSADPLCIAMWSVLSLLISYCGSSALAWCVYPL